MTDATLPPAPPPSSANPVRPATGRLRLAEVVAALSYALDLTGGQSEGHALQSCVVGMAVGAELGLEGGELSDLYYTLLLKDLGCSSTAARTQRLFGADDRRVKRASKLTNFDNLLEALPFVLTYAGQAVPLYKRLKYVLDVSLGRHGGHTAITRERCEQGAEVARLMGFSEGVAAGIRALDEHHDGSGRPYRLEGEAIPVVSRVACLAQTVALFFEEGGADAARRAVRDRTGSWFDPAVAAAFFRAEGRAGFWEGLAAPGLERRVRSLEPRQHTLAADDELLDRVAEAFARVIDAKSPWTYGHSERVRRFALGAAAQLPEPLPDEQLERLSRGALLHDIGQLGVSNLVLDKQGELTLAEFGAVKRHPTYGELILGRVTPFRDLARFAGGHHERLDGRGYPRALPASHLTFEVRLLSVADQFEALTAARPHRDRLTPDAALAVLHDEVGSAVDPAALEALEAFLVTAEAAPLLEPTAPATSTPLEG